MIEFDSTQGGRYTYIDDIVNLQDLALSITEMFSDCGNFIVSGCRVNGNTISQGLVHINGKLRRFSGATGISGWPQYIYESNRTESVSYASGQEKVGRKVYGCSISSTIPTSIDEVTGNTPSYITINSQNLLNRTISSAFFGKETLLKNNPAVQALGGSMSAHSIVAEDIVASDHAYIGNTDNVLSVLKKSGGFELKETTLQSNCSLWFKQNGAIEVSAEGERKVVFSGSTTNFVGNVVFRDNTRLGDVCIDGDDIYNMYSPYDSGVLNINMSSVNGSYSKFRTTNIGNGKGTPIIKVNGQEDCVYIYKDIRIPTTSKIIFSNNSSTSVAEISINGLDNSINIGSGNGDIVLSPDQYLEIDGYIKENGCLLSEVYALATDLAVTNNTKANKSDVYTKSQSDSKYALLNGGLSQLKPSGVTTEVAKQQMRSEIGAVGTDEAIMKSMLLSDIGTSTTAKRAICNNIGAMYASDGQPKIADSGWVACLGRSNSLYARKIGNVVYLQGTVTVAAGEYEAFTLPSTSFVPSKPIGFTISGRSQIKHFYINGNETNCMCNASSTSVFSEFVTVSYCV